MQRGEPAASAQRRHAQRHGEVRARLHCATRGRPWWPPKGTLAAVRRRCRLVSLIAGESAIVHLRVRHASPSPLWAVPSSPPAPHSRSDPSHLPASRTLHRRLHPHSHGLVALDRQTHSPSRTAARCRRSPKTPCSRRLPGPLLRLAHHRRLCTHPRPQLTLSTARHRPSLQHHASAAHTLQRDRSPHSQPWITHTAPRERRPPAWTLTPWPPN